MDIKNYKLEPKKISKEELFSLDENDLMFITNPGRMGDEDGSTFIIKKNNNYIPYRVTGLMYSNPKNNNDYISIKDMFNIFPKWKDSWHNNYEKKKHDGKYIYIYIYMGFGNGLCVDKSIYKTYYPYLIDEIKNSGATINENEECDPTLIYSLWSKALVKMIISESNKSD